MSDKAWVGISMTKQQFGSLYRCASRKGIHPADLCAEWVLEELQIALEDEGMEPLGDVDQMYLITQRHEDRVGMHMQLKRLAYTAARSTAEEDMILFQQACEVMKADPKEIMREVGYYRELPPVDIEGVGVPAAMNWLTSLIPMGNQIPTNDVLSVGSDAGFSEGTLRTAKKKLGMISERQSSEWVWKWPESMTDVQ